MAKTQSQKHAEITIALDAENKALKAELAAKTCVWKHEADNYEYPQDGDDFWNTGCGHAYRFNEGGLKENGVKFCMYCGGKITLPKKGGE